MRETKRPGVRMSKRGKWFCLALCLILGLLVLLVLIKPPEPIAKEKVEGERTKPGVTGISLDCFVEYSEASVTAKEVVYFTNTTGKELSSIVFHAPPPHHGFSLKTADVDGVPANYSLSGIVLEVSHTLSPGQSCNIELDFVVTLPEYSHLNRTSSISGVLILGNWFPTVAVFEGGDWDRHQWNSIGDPFFTECTDFEVDVTVDNPHVVASTGELTSHVGNRWKFQAENARDFAMAIGPLQTTSTQIDGIEITVYAVDGDLSDFVLDEATEEIREMNASVGPYAYDSLDVVVVPTPSDHDSWGMEYPSIIILYGLEDVPMDNEWISIVTRHETVHQWFYAAIGNDQLEEPWLDEAFAVFFSEPVGNQIHPGIDRSIWEFGDWSEYSAVVYRGAAAFLAELRDFMGEDSFFAGLREYYDRYKFRVASGKDFFRVMQSHTSKDLSPLIGRYFNK